MKKKNNIIVLFPVPLQGHITPMLHLASLLHSCNFSITVVHSNFNSPDPKLYPEFHFISVADGITADFAASSNSPFSLISAINSSCPATFYDAMVELLKSSEVRCVVVDSVLFRVKETARCRLGLPVFSVMSSSVACFNTFFAYPFTAIVRSHAV